MADGRRTRWVAHDVYFLDEGLGEAMFDRFGATGIALWHGFIAACKKNHVEGQTSWASTEEALTVLGLPGMNLVNNDGEAFKLDDWLQLLSDHKVIRRTARGRRLKVACTKWARWQQSAKRAREADRKARDRTGGDEQNDWSDDEKASPEHRHPPDEASPDTDRDTDTDNSPEGDGENRAVDPLSNGTPLSKREADRLRALGKFTAPRERSNLHAAYRDLLAASLDDRVPEEHLGVTLGLIAELVERVGGERLHSDARSHAARLVRTFDPLRVFDGFGEAMVGGAAIKPEFREDSLALSRYVAAVLHGKGERSRP